MLTQINRAPATRASRPAFPTQNGSIAFKETKMNSKIKAIGGALLACLIGTAGAAPAVAAPLPWVAAHHHHFYHRGYNPGYYRHYAPGYYNYAPGYYRYGYYGYGYDPGPAIVGGLIGGVFGTIAGAAIAHGGSGHVARCERAYRSYVPATNTYTGYDGLKHVCRL
jgi:hypothetical protein